MENLLEFSTTDGRKICYFPSDMDLDWDASNVRCGELLTGATLAYIPDSTVYGNIVTFYMDLIKSGAGYI